MNGDVPRTDLAGLASDAYLAGDALAMQTRWEHMEMLRLAADPVQMNGCAQRIFAGLLIVHDTSLQDMTVRDVLALVQRTRTLYEAWLA